MKLLYFIILSAICFSFYPGTEKTNNSTSGFYIFVEDLSDKTYHKYIVESKDSVNHIIKSFFKSELELGDIQKPISIYNGDLNFYIARVNIIVKPNGEKGFRNLKYSITKKNKRLSVRPVSF
jgi:hypothetical protein